MQTSRVTRSSVLGKRCHQQQQESSTLTSLSSKSVDQLLTPDTTPVHKRPRIATLSVDADGNKENVPPFSPRLLTPDPSPVNSRVSRALRRSGTEIMSPTRTRTAGVRRHASMSTVADTVAIPSPQSTITTTPSSPAFTLPLHTRARTLLRSTCNGLDTQFAGRESERSVIRDFIASFVDLSSMDMDTVHSTLYISGSPGCGKTALVNSVLDQLSSDMNGVKIIFINCMALNNLDALWERMLEELEAAKKENSSPSKCRKLKGREAIEALLTKLHTKCVLILDELDHITPNTQALSTLFSLSTATPSYLRVIGIANTHTLTSTSSSIATNVRTVHFAPYTSTQLFEILQSRLRPLYEVQSQCTGADPSKFLPTPPLTLLTKKIAGMTGDVRSLFEVLRGAIDVALTPKISSDAQKADAPVVSVTPSHIVAALKAYKPSSAKSKLSNIISTSTTTVSNSETVTKVKNLNLQARLVLLAVIIASKRTEAGLSLSGATLTASPRKSNASPLRRTNSAPTTSISSSIDTNQLHTYYSAVLARSDAGVFEPVNRSELGDLLNVLEGNGLVCLSSSGGAAGRRAFGRSSSFGGGITRQTAGNVGTVKLVEGIWNDELLRGLGIDATLPKEVGVDVDICEEEVKAIWQREQTKLAKDVKSKAMTSNNNSADLFTGAFEE